MGLFDFIDDIGDTLSAIADDPFSATIAGIGGFLGGGFVGAGLAVASFGYQAERAASAKRKLTNRLNAAIDANLGVEINSVNAVNSIPICYGYSAIHARQTYVSSSDSFVHRHLEGFTSFGRLGSFFGKNNDVLRQQTVLCTNEIDDLVSVQINGLNHDEETIVDDYVIQYGPKGIANAILSETDDNRDENSKYQNAQFMTAWFRFNRQEANFIGGFPRVVCFVKGKRINPIGSTSRASKRFSNNSAEIVNDFLVDEIGLRRDQIDSDSFRNAVAYCNQEIGRTVKYENVFLNSESNTTQIIRKGEFNGLLSSGDTDLNNINAVLETIPGVILYYNKDENGGKYKISVPDNDTPIRTITDDDIIDGVTIVYPSLDERINKCNVTFTNGLDLFAQQVITEESDILKARDNGFTLEGNITMVGVSDPVSARYQAITTIRESRLMTFSFKINIQHLDLEPGDILRLHNGEVDQIVRIVRLNVDERFETTLECIEYSSDVYNIDNLEILERRLDPPVDLRLPVITGINIQSDVSITSPSDDFQRMRISWDAPNESAVAFTDVYVIDHDVVPETRTPIGILTDDDNEIIYSPTSRNRISFQFINRSRDGNSSRTVGTGNFVPTPWLGSFDGNPLPYRHLTTTSFTDDPRFISRTNFISITENGQNHIRFAYVDGNMINNLRYYTSINSVNSPILFVNESNREITIKYFQALRVTNNRLQATNEISSFGPDLIDNERYTVFFQDKNTFNTAIDELRNVDTPDTPDNVVLSAIEGNNDQILLSWSNPLSSNVPGNEFVITRNSQPYSVVPFYENSLIINGINTETSVVQIGIKQRNASGESDTVTVEYALTTPNTITNLRTEQTNVDNVLLKFDYAFQRGVQVSGYELQQRSGPQANWENVALIDSQVREHLITNVSLQGQIRFRIRVLSTNNMTSEWSEELIFNGDVPNVPMITGLAVIDSLGPQVSVQLDFTYEENFAKIARFEIEEANADIDANLFRRIGSVEPNRRRFYAYPLENGNIIYRIRAVSYSELASQYNTGQLFTVGGSITDANVYSSDSDVISFPHYNVNPEDITIDDIDDISSFTGADDVNGVLTQDRDTQVPFTITIQLEVSQETIDKGLSFYPRGFPQGIVPIIQLKTVGLRDRKVYEDPDNLAYVTANGEGEKRYEEDRLPNFWYRDRPNISLYVYRSIRFQTAGLYEITITIPKNLRNPTRFFDNPGKIIRFDAFAKEKIFTTRVMNVDSTGTVVDFSSRDFISTEGVFLTPEANTNVWYTELTNTSVRVHAAQSTNVSTTIRGW